MPTPRRSLTALLGLPLALTALVVLPTGAAHAHVAGAVAGTPRAATASITAGTAHSCAITANAGGTSGSVRCWGRNDAGQLGLGDLANRGDEPGEMGASLPAVELGGSAVAITSSASHTCALLDNGRVKCWGLNAAGQLGLGDLANRGDEPGEMGASLPVVELGTGRTVRMISAGSSHTCAILDDGTVKCWGDNADGQLGTGGTADIGDAPGEMGDALAPVDLGPGRTAIAISAGLGHTCAILDTHQVKCWGRNLRGQLGLGDTANRGDQPGEMGADLPTVDLGTGMTARAIATGVSHTCALLTETAMRCWGLNSSGQLGHGTTIAKGDDPGEMGDTLRLLDLAPTALRITGITASGTVTCAVWEAVSGTVRNRISCWGGNAQGQLGLGTTTPDGTTGGDAWLPTSMTTGPVIAAAGGNGHTCVVALDKGVRCIGWNASGQLGIGTTDNQGDAPLEVFLLADIDLRGDVADDVLVLPVVPAIPTGAAAVAGSLQAQLTWTAPATDGGTPVTGYRVERSLDDGATWTVLVANTASTATTRTITGLVGGQAVRFRVAAINAAGSSAASLPSAAVAPTAPFLPLTPARIADTRPDGETVDGIGQRTGRLAAGQTLRVQITGRADVPIGAAAAVLNVTAVAPDGPGFLTVHPCDTDQPNASSVNYQRGQVVPNAVITKLAGDGSACIFSLAAVDVLVDVTGAYPAGAIYTPLAPARLADTRPDGQTVDGQGRATGLLRNQLVQVLTVQVAGRGNVPTGATAAVLNVTAVTPDRAGFLTVFPCDRDQPNASSVNYSGGQVVANAVITKLAADGTVCVASSADTTHVLVDVVGAFPTGADYTPLLPARFADSRPDGITVDGEGAATGVLGAGQTLRVRIAGRDQVPAGATAAVLNVTAVTPAAGGFLTVYPCDATKPNASSVNYAAGQVVPNAVITKLAADGSVCIFTLAGTHVLVDVTGAS